MTDLVVSVHRANSAGRPRGAKAARRFVEALLAATALVAVTATSVVPAGASALDDSAEVEVQEPFLCTTEYNDLGQPNVDNQDRRGTPVYPESEPDTPDRSQEPLGWSKDCQADTRIEYRYRNTDGEVVPLNVGDGVDATLPADVAYLAVSDLVGADDMDLGGDTRIPYLYRYERGTLPDTRFIYSVAMLVPFSEVVSGAPDDSHWNGRLVYSFGGGVGIGHSQGSLSGGDSQLDEALRLGHAVVYSSGTRTSVHYNLLRGAEVAKELKARFIDQHGEPLYTVGIGGSGGGIQQYVYAQNVPDLLDALIPQYAYPDMTTQTINVGDCELLEYYMDVTAADDPMWKDWDNRKILQGQNTIEGFSSDWSEATGDSGSSECIEGWRGATPLALNPNFGLAADMDDALMPFAGELLSLAGAGDPAVPEDFPDIGAMLRTSTDRSEWVDWTHWDDAVDAYGTDPATGEALVPWDNVGVQYGLRAVANGQITPDQFLDLNARIGSWKPASEQVPESCGMVAQMTGETLGAFAEAVGMCEGDELDQYSSRQMNLELVNGVAPRREADVAAITNAFESGLEFDGKLGRDIPILDVRHYLEDELDMHNVHQSFVIRERIRRAMGAADNHVVWFADARPGEDTEATSALLDRVYRVMDEWVLALHNDADATAASAKPVEAVDACFATDGTPIASGDHVWDGAVELVLSGEGAWTSAAPREVDGVEVGDCASQFPIHSTSRVVAGGPITNDVYKCHLKPVATALADGDYGSWTPDESDMQRLEAIFATGVCDWSKRSVGYPADLASGGGAADSGPAEGHSTDDDSDSLPWIFLGAVGGLIVVGLALRLVARRGDGSEDPDVDMMVDMTAATETSE
ncbi:MAG: hypothetical protein KDB20_02240 [Microthrixaceae bacterium]|nr:hypothetical protein [Microthrixaceae bacterium]